MEGRSVRRWSSGLKEKKQKGSLVKMKGRKRGSVGARERGRIRVRLKGRERRKREGNSKRREGYLRHVLCCFASAGPLRQKDRGRGGQRSAEKQQAEQRAHLGKSGDE